MTQPAAMQRDQIDYTTFGIEPAPISRSIPWGEIQRVALTAIGLFSVAFCTATWSVIAAPFSIGGLGAAVYAVGLYFGTLVNNQRAQLAHSLQCLDISQAVRNELERTRLYNHRITEDARYEANEDTPDRFVCPITREIIRFPVVIPEGTQSHAYERGALLEYYRQGARNSPLTRTPLPPRHTLSIDWRLQEAITAHLVETKGPLA